MYLLSRTFVVTKLSNSSTASESGKLTKKLSTEKETIGPRMSTDSLDRSKCFIVFVDRLVKHPEDVESTRETWLLLKLVRKWQRLLFQTQLLHRRGLAAWASAIVQAYAWMLYASES